MQLKKQGLEKKLKEVHEKIQQIQDNARATLNFLEGQRQLLQEQLAELEKPEAKPKDESSKAESAESSAESKKPEETQNAKD